MRTRTILVCFAYSLSTKSRLSLTKKLDPYCNALVHTCEDDHFASSNVTVAKDPQKIPFSCFTRSTLAATVSSANPVCRDHERPVNSPCDKTAPGVR